MNNFLENQQTALAAHNLQLNYMRTLTFIIAFLVVGCATSQQPILLCPEAQKASNGNWTTLRESLFKINGEYWLTDISGQPIQAYRYRHDYIPIFESAITVENQSKEHPAHISSPIIFKRPKKDIVIHLVLEGEEKTIPLGSADLERHADFDVLYIQ